MARSKSKPKVIETDTPIDPVAADQQEAPPSAGPTPEMQADDPPEAFESDPNQPDLTPSQDGHPSAGPTPEMQENDPAPMFEPAPEPEPDPIPEPVQHAPSAGPTPEDLEKQDEAAKEAEKAASDAEKGAKAHERKAKAARETIDELVENGFLVPYNAVSANPNDTLYTLKV